MSTPQPKTDIRWIADDSVEAACLKDFGELRVPVERVDVQELLAVEARDVGGLVEVRADKGVAALDVPP